MDISWHEFVLTSDERSLFLQELDQVSKTLFSTKTAKGSDLASLHLRQTTLPFFLELARLPVDQASQELEKIRSEILALSIIRLTVAYPLDQQTTDRLHSELKKRGNGHSFLLDTEYDQSIGAGAVLVEDGKVHDESLRKRIQELDLQKILSKHLTSFS